MTLKQLEAFYWAATCANFAIAAQRVNLSISSLSKRITELEQSLGVTLFDRSGHRAELTAAGQDLIKRALDLLDSASSIRNAFSADNGLIGRCRFGVGELSALTWLPNFIAQVRHQHPSLMLEPCVDVGASLEERVDNGELDFAIIAGRSSRRKLLVAPVASAQFVWVAAPSLYRRGVKTADLLRQGVPLIAQPASAGTTRLIDDWLLANQVVALERITCNNWGAIAGMIVAGVGVGILPQGWAGKLNRQDALGMPDGKSRLTPLTYSFHWRRGDSRPLLDRMRMQVAESADFSAVVQLPGSAGQ